VQVGTSTPRRRPQLVDLNLVPVEFRPRRFPFLTVGLALAILGATLLLFALAYLSGNAHLEVARLTKQVEQAQGVVNAAKGDAASANRERQRVLAMQDDYHLLADRQVAWSRVLGAIMEAPAGVSVDSIEQSGFAVTVRGSAPSYGVATEYLAQLRASGLFDDIALEVTGEAPAESVGAVPAFDLPTATPSSTQTSATPAAGTPTRPAAAAPVASAASPTSSPTSSPLAPPTSTASPTATQTRTPGRRARRSRRRRSTTPSHRGARARARSARARSPTFAGASRTRTATPSPGRA